MAEVRATKSGFSSDMQQKWLSIAKELGDKLAECRALGNAHMLLGQFEVSAQLYSKMLRIAMQLGDRALEAQACYSLGNTYTLLKDNEQAIEYHIRHLRIAQDLKDRIGEGRGCWSLSCAYTSLGHDNTALKYASQHLEISLEINSKYDSDLAQQCLVWIKDVINSDLQPGEDLVDFSTDGDIKNFGTVLHDGVVLARLANCLTCGSVPSSKYAKAPKLPFKQMELIELFIKKAKEFGVPDHELFQTVDLYEEQNLHQVVICFQSLGRKAKAKGLQGFGPKEADANPRSFSEEQMRAGENVIGLQMGTNKGASQAGMTFGKQRMILD